MNTIGCNICSLRKQNNLSQEQLAEMLDVSRQSVSKWERDETLPDIKNLEALSQIFGVSIDALVKGDEKSTGNSTPIITPILTKAQVEAREDLLMKAKVFLIAAIVLYIITVFSIPVLIMSMGVSDESVIALYFGLGVAIATGMIIYSAAIKAKCRRMYGGVSVDEDEEDDEDMYERFQQKHDGGLFAYIIRSVALIVFLYLGFFHGLWHPGWLVFVVAGIISRVYYGVFGIADRKKEQDNDYIIE